MLGIFLQVQDIISILIHLEVALLERLNIVIIVLQFSISKRNLLSFFFNKMLAHRSILQLRLLILTEPRLYLNGVLEGSLLQAL